ncbi:MAG: hypothetical protein M3Y84_12815 [Acidobacteriota bacterium]|nr:hypothetical protein [Acidobacteriota bacterium]
MKKFIALSGLFIAFVCLGPAAEAKGDDFGAVVRVIEQFYHVKHRSLPFLARAGMKTAATAARVAGGSKKRLVEAGSVKIAFFEDQEFDSRGEAGKFRASMKATLAGTWLPFIQVLPQRKKTRLTSSCETPARNTLSL